MKEYLAGYYCRDTLHLRIVNKESNRKILEALKDSYPLGLDVYELAEKTDLPLKTIYGQKTELYREYYISHYAEETKSTKRGRPKIQYHNLPRNDNGKNMWNVKQVVSTMSFLCFLDNTLSVKDEKGNRSSHKIDENRAATRKPIPIMLAIIDRCKCRIFFC